MRMRVSRSIRFIATISFFFFLTGCGLHMAGQTDGKNSRADKIVREPLPAGALLDNRPEELAAEALKNGDFRLIHVGYGWYETSPGVNCAVYPLSRSGIRHVFHLSSQETAENRTYRAQVADFSRRYNHAVISDESYPDYDICYPADEGWVSGRSSPSELAEFLGWKGDPGRVGEGSNLLRAARFGHLQKVEAFLKRGEDPDQIDAWGLSPLNWASGRGRKDIVSVLLAHKADFNFAGESQPARLLIGPESLNASLRLALLADHVDILDLLVSHIRERKQGCQAETILAPAVVMAAELNRGGALKTILPAKEAETICPATGKALLEAIAIAQSNNHAVLANWLQEQRDLWPDQVK